MKIGIMICSFGMPFLCIRNDDSNHLRNNRLSFYFLLRIIIKKEMSSPKAVFHVTLNTAGVIWPEYTHTVQFYSWRI